MRAVIYGVILIMCTVVLGANYELHKKSNIFKDQRIFLTTVTVPILLLNSYDEIYQLLCYGKTTHIGIAAIVLLPSVVLASIYETKFDKPVFGFVNMEILKKVNIVLIIVVILICIELMFSWPV